MMKYHEKLQNHQTSRHSKQLVTREEIVITVFFSLSFHPDTSSNCIKSFFNQIYWLKRQFYRLICCHHKILLYSSRCILFLPYDPAGKSYFSFDLLGAITSTDNYGG